MTEKGWQFC